MSQAIIIRGENRLVVRNLRETDGTTPLYVGSLTHVKCELIQFGFIQAKYRLGSNPELRLGASADQVVLELTSAMSATLAAGPLRLRWEFERVDGAFAVEPDQMIERIIETIGTIQSENSLTGRSNLPDVSTLVSGFGAAPVFAGDFAPAYNGDFSVTPGSGGPTGDFGSDFNNDF